MFTFFTFLFIMWKDICYIIWVSFNLIWYPIFKVMAIIYIWNRQSSSRSRVDKNDTVHDKIWYYKLLSLFCLSFFDLRILMTPLHWYLPTLLIMSSCAIFMTFKHGCWKVWIYLYYSFVQSLSFCTLFRSL
jgi:hypothetical protein